MRSLETKWGIFKHDVSKFIRNFGNHENILKKGLRILQVKASKGLEVYFHSLFVGFERYPLLGQHAHWCNIKSQNNA
jgi:hypothetical protein